MLSNLAFIHLFLHFGTEMRVGIRMRGGLYLWFQPFKVRALREDNLCVERMTNYHRTMDRALLEATNQPPLLFIFMKTECQEHSKPSGNKAWK